MKASKFRPCFTVYIISGNKHIVIVN